MKQTLSDVAGRRKWAARERLFSLLGYDSAARHKRAEKGTEILEKLRNQTYEAQERRRNDNESDVLCA